MAWDLLTASTTLLQAGKPTRKKSDFGVFRNNAFFRAVNLWEVEKWQDLKLQLSREKDVNYGIIIVASLN